MKPIFFLFAFSCCNLFAQNTVIAPTDYVEIIGVQEQSRFYSDIVYDNNEKRRVPVINGYLPIVHQARLNTGGMHIVYDYSNKIKYTSYKKNKSNNSKELDERRKKLNDINRRLGVEIDKLYKEKSEFYKEKKNGCKEIKLKHQK